MSARRSRDTSPRFSYRRAPRLEGLEERRLLSVTVEGMYVASGEVPTAGEPFVQWSFEGGGNGHAYEFVDDLLSWHDAAEAAAMRPGPEGFANGHLATLSSAAENAFLAESLPSLQAWIGFTDEIVEGEWRWVDDTNGIWQDRDNFDSPIQSAFTSWHPAEPNNNLPGIGQDFGLFNYQSPGLWDDFDAEADFIVEFEPLPSVHASIAEGQILPFDVPQLVVAFSDELDTSAGRFNAHSSTNPANWSLTRNGTDISSRVNSIDWLFNPDTERYEAILNLDAPLGTGSYTLVAHDEIHDLAGTSLDGNSDGAPGGDYTLNFSVESSPISAPAKTGNEFRVNTTTALDQRFWEPVPEAVAMDADGDFVVTWSSQAQDGDG